MAGRRVWAGLDLSARLDLTAAIFVDEEGHVWPMFWAPAEGLQDQAHRDRVPYDVWARQGHLRLTPGRSVDYGFAVRDIAEATGGAEVVAVGFDRWRIDLFRRELELAGLSLPLVPHGGVPRYGPGARPPRGAAARRPVTARRAPGAYHVRR